MDEYFKDEMSIDKEALALMERMFQQLSRETQRGAYMEVKDRLEYFHHHTESSIFVIPCQYDELKRLHKEMKLEDEVSKRFQISPLIIQTTPSSPNQHLEKMFAARNNDSRFIPTPFKLVKEQKKKPYTKNKPWYQQFDKKRK